MQVLKPTEFTFRIDKEDKPKISKKKLENKNKETRDEDHLPKLAENDVVYDYLIVNFKNIKKKDTKKKTDQENFNKNNCLLNSSIYGGKEQNIKEQKSVVKNKISFNNKKIEELKDKYLQNLIFVEKPPRKIKNILNEFKVKKQEEKILNKNKKNTIYNKTKNNQHLKENFENQKSRVDNNNISHALEYFKTIQQLLTISKKEKKEKESIFTDITPIKKKNSFIKANQFGSQVNLNINFFHQQEFADEVVILNKNNKNKNIGKNDNKNLLTLISNKNDIKKTEFVEEKKNENIYSQVNNYDIKEIESILTDSVIEEENECSFELIDENRMKELNKKHEIIKFYEKEENGVLSLPQHDSAFDQKKVETNVKNDLNFIFSDLLEKNKNLVVKENLLNSESKTKEDIIKKSKLFIEENKLSLDSLKNQIEEIKKINIFFKEIK